MMHVRTLSGRIAFQEPIAAHAATVRVLVEDVTHADARATVVAEVTIPLAQPLTAGQALPFALDVPVEGDAQGLNVRAHVDFSGDGTIVSGDRVSTQAHPVLTRGAPDSVEVIVERI